MKRCITTKVNNMNSNFIKSLLTFTAILLFLVNCRGEISEKPPLHLNMNMDFQPKERAQDIARPIPEGTVAFGYEEDMYNDRKSSDLFLNENLANYTGTNLQGAYLDRVPMPVTKDVVLRGQQRFNIYCAACHDRVGTSQAIVIKRGVGIPPPPRLDAENIIAQKDGQIFNTIKYGIRNMPGYGSQITTKDMWAIVSYVRAIQASRTASLSEYQNRR